MTRWGRAAMAVLVATVAACEPRRARPPSAPTAISDAPPDDDAHLAWAESEPWLVVVRKACRTVDVYRHGDRVETFPAVFGLGNPGSKLYEGDRKTPTGLYAIIDKRRHARWQHFMLLDYPNLEDMHRYWLAMESGQLPRLGGQSYPGIGGAVGIHGTDRPESNAREVDWTWGCISLSPKHIDQFATLVPVGTLVLIED